MQCICSCLFKCLSAQNTVNIIQYVTLLMAAQVICYYGHCKYLETRFSTMVSVESPVLLILVFALL